METNYVIFLIISIIFNEGFGFCEYSDPEAALRAMRLLSGFHVADKKLLVSCF